MRPRGCFGLKLEAAIAALTVRNRLSRRQLVEVLDELFGCPIAVGTIDTILTRTAETLEPVYDELLAQTRAAVALNVDETCWYLGGESRTLWGAFSRRTAVLRIAPSRGKVHLAGLIGDEFAGAPKCFEYSGVSGVRAISWLSRSRKPTPHNATNGEK